MILQNPLEAFSNPNADYPILCILEKSDNPLTTTAIFKRCRDIPRISVHKSLIRMSEHGIVDQELLGNTYYYMLNRNHILFPVIKGLVHVTDNLIEIARKSLTGWQTAPKCVYLFGSAARKDMTVSSDLDLLFVLEDDETKKDLILDNIYELCESLRKIIGNEINPVIFRPSEVKNTPLFRDILKEGVCIYGDRTLLKRRVENGR